jgi:hypothetical protein
VKRLIALVAALFFLGSLAFINPYHAGGHSKSHSYHSSSHSSSSRRAAGVKRDSHGRIERNSSAKQKFMYDTGYPHGRKGYVVDHRVPLKRSGADSPSNMQWQTKGAAKEKDKWE